MIFSCAKILFLFDQAEIQQGICQQIRSYPDMDSGAIISGYSDEEILVHLEDIIDIDEMTTI